MAECAGMGLHCKTVVSVVADPKMEYPTGLMRLLAKVLFRFADGIVFQTKEAMDFSRRLSEKRRNPAKLLKPPVYPGAV